MSTEEVAMRQPIKRLEIAIGKFNDVAIPYHLELLKRHKANVKRVSKYLHIYDYSAHKRDAQLFVSNRA